MERGIIRTISGTVVEMSLINNIADEVIKQIKSKLPEEARTYDTAKYILRIANEKNRRIKKWITKNEDAFLEVFRQ